MTTTELAIRFFLQLTVILAACRAVGLLAAKFGQPQVIAEMITGVLLGPSLLGLYWPGGYEWLFPKQSLNVLYPVSQLGLAAYMFIVGLEFRMDIVHQKLRSAVAVSIAGMVAPFIMGAGLGWAFYHWTDFFPAPTGLLEAMLFLGASMCITAFPMLARIIEHKKLKGTAMGAVSLGAGAMNDATAWCLLGVVLASRTNDWGQAFINIGAGIGYVALVLSVVRPLLHRLQHRFLENGSLSAGGMSVILVLMCAGAWFTDLIGLHAVLGAFVVGVAIPRGPIVRDLIARVEPLTVALLLPLFFAYSGLNTRMGLLDSGFLWLMCLAVVAAATVGKGVACWLAARATGIPNREALGIGTLMNVRGLMELIIINIGLEKGIISPGLFAILVVMAVATTVIASPIFDRLTGYAPGTVPDADPLPVGNPVPASAAERSA